MWLALAIGLCVFGFLVIMYGFWPGVMIDDARWQYQQVVDNAFEDWHPPLMAWTWRRLTAIEPGPAPMLVLQLALYWGGIAAIAGTAYRRGKPRLAVALAVTGFIPAPLALGGTVVKDVLMAGLLTSAIAMALWRGLVRSGAGRISLTLGGATLLVLAAAIRFNAFLACVPLLLIVAPRAFVQTRFRLVATLLCGTLVFLAAGPLVATLVSAEKTNPELSLIIFDLGGITERSGVNQFPDPGVADPVAVNHRCYDPFEWDSYSDWAKVRCPIGFSHFQSVIDEGDVDPRSVWLGAIATHPIAYAAHRLAHFNQSTWFLVPSGPKQTAWTQSVDNPWGFKVRAGPLPGALAAVADGTSRTPLGWPVFWLCAALATLVVGRSAKVSLPAMTVPASALIYGLGYLAIGVATGMRYYVWPITGAGLGAVLVLGEIAGGRSAPSRRAVITAIAFVVVPMLSAVAARIV